MSQNLFARVNQQCTNHFCDKKKFQASNPGQFEPPDSDATWQKNGSTLFYNSGSVAIGTDRAVAPLTVGGDIYCSGVLHRPSDRRIKEQIHEVSTFTACLPYVKL